MEKELNIKVNKTNVSIINFLQNIEFEKLIDLKWFIKEKLLNKILIILLVVTTFIYPFFSLQSTIEYFETPKSLILGILVLLSLILYGVKIIQKNKVSLIKTNFLLPIVILLISAVLSYIFSLSPEVSFWGYNSRFYGGLFSSILYILLFYSLVNLLETKESVRAIITTMISSIVFISIFTVLKSLGALDNLFSWMVTANEMFEPLRYNVTNIYGDVNGDTQSFGIFLLMGLNLIFGYKIIRKENSIYNYVFWGILYFVVAFSLGIYLNSCTVVEKVMYLLVALIPIIVGLVKTGKDGNLIQKVAPVVASAIAILVIFAVPKVSTFLLDNAKYGTDYDVDFSTSWTVTLETYKEYGLKGLLLGTGQGTYSYDFSSFKPIEQNSKVNWNVDMHRSGSALLDLVTTTGLVSLLALLYFVYSIVKHIIKNKKSFFNSEDLLPIISFFLIMAFGFIVSSVGSTIMLYGIIIFVSYNLFAKFEKYPEVENDEIIIKLSSVNKLGTEEKNVLPLVIGLLLTIISILCLIGILRSYSAEMEYSRAGKLLGSSDPDYTEIKSTINKAVNSFPKRDYYRRQKSLILISELKSELSKVPVSQEEVSAGTAYQTAILDDLKVELQEMTKDNSFFGTFGTSKRKDISVNYMNWQARAEVLRNLFDLSSGKMYGEEAIVVISKAIELSPYDPNSYIVLGLLYEGSADEELKTRAEEVFIAGYNVQPGYFFGINVLGMYLETVKGDVESARNLYQFSLDNYYTEESVVKDYLEERIYTLNQTQNSTSTPEVTFEETQNTENVVEDGIGENSLIENSIIE